MTALTSLVAEGNGWLLLPSAVALGALHGLEPGHSKTMMAAFIVAIRGTFTQAVLLGLSATISHTLIVWCAAFAGLYFGSQWRAATTEAYFQLVSGLAVMAIATWMLWRAWAERARRADDATVADEAAPHGHAHDRGHEHEHDHEHGHAHADDHEREHAEEIARRFANRQASTAQVVLFGLTGGLIPCPSAIAVLILCLHLQRFALGAALVLGFSVGLALTLVAVGLVAALGVRHLSGRWRGFESFAYRARYISALLVLAVGGFVTLGAWRSMAA